MEPLQSYAILMLPTGQEFDHNERFALLPDLHTWCGTLLDLIHHSQLDHWASTMGTYRWKDLVGGSRFVFICAPDPRSEDSDKVPSHLRWRMRLTHQAMLVTPMDSP